MSDEGFARNLYKLFGGLGGCSDISDMAHRKLASVILNAEKTLIVFRFQDGFARAFAVEGDCCSSSWIEHLELPGDVAGAEIVSVADDRITRDDSNPEHECLQVYHTRFVTDRGEIVLEYRNSSNGYYGGYLVDAVAPAVED